MPTDLLAVLVFALATFGGLAGLYLVGRAAVAWVRRRKARRALRADRQGSVEHGAVRYAEARPGPPPRTFLDDITGHRMWLLGALCTVTANALWALRIIDTAAYCLALGTIAAFLGGNTLTDAVRDKANQPPAPPEPAVEVGRTDSVNVELDTAHGETP